MKAISLKYAAKAQLLPVMEAFLTIQGEGFHQGKPSYFIRLAGCDVGCHWCDVKESWDASLHPEAGVDQLVETAGSFHAKMAVITGGEPLMHDLEGLTSSLKLHGLHTHLETSGTHPLSGSWDWICFSPKKFKAPLPQIYDFANELKVVIYHPSDLKWAEQHAAKVNPECKLFLQPEWSKRETIMPLLVDYVKKNPDWRISLQVHKYLNIP